MLNQAQNIVSAVQFDRMIKSLDDALQVYSEAVFILFVVVLAIVLWLALCELRQSKASKKSPFKDQAVKEGGLLQTEP